MSNSKIERRYALFFFRIVKYANNDDEYAARRSSHMEQTRFQLFGRSLLTKCHATDGV